MGMEAGISAIQVNTGDLAAGSSLAAYLTDAAGALLTSTLFGSKQALDVNTVSEKLDGSAYTAAADYLMAIAGVDNSGNYKPFNIDASGNLKVSGSFSTSFTAEHNEDAAFTDGDSGIGVLLVRQDTLTSSTSADGDYGSFKSNNLGELYVHDTSALAELVLIKGDTASIVTNTGTTATNTGTIATSTSSIDSTLTGLSKAEDAAHSSGDKGIQALAVRKDAQGTNVSNDGDYASLLTWAEGSLKVVDIANGSMLQQTVALSTTAAKVPATPLATRKSVMLQNNSDKIVYIGSSTVTNSGSTQGQAIYPKGFMELEVGPAIDVWAVAATGTPSINVLEIA